ncbi:hypothetical protein N0V95_001614 [Ascochyta clinopodiicola]|nr:hypothetical protein N0V95_001614 [Ascochyta clinopodiicola]
MSTQPPAPHAPGVPLARLADETSTTEGTGLLAKGKKLLGLSGGGQQEGIGQAEQDAFAKAEEVAPTRTLSPTTTTWPTSSAPTSVPTSVPTSAPSLLPSPPLTAAHFDRRASPRGSPRMAPVGIGASPTRRIHRSSSPGLHSPASSQIFERNVQEPELSPAIPNHVKTEDMIPPALDASALAITDDHLNPEKVEIVTHSAHQAAATTVSASMADSVYSPSLAPDDSAPSAHADTTDPTPNYGSLDTDDVKRLSFISFADVVQAEHVESDRESFGPGEGIQFMSLNSTSANRSPSPVRSPLSSTSPPTSGAPSEKGVEHERTRSPSSPSPSHVAHNAPLSEELPLQVETMREAIRKTGTSGETPPHSQPLSPVSIEGERPFR